MDCSFSEAVESIRLQDPRYDREAYAFVRDALDHTVRGKTRGKGEGREHVSGQELLAGLREYALEQFGPMVPTVLEHFGIQATYDVGCIVFNLIEAGIFGKTDRDSLEDFRDVFDFEDAFVRPFRAGLSGGRNGTMTDAVPCASPGVTATSAPPHPAPAQG